MCDQDHFDDDLKEFEARGMVTRRQFGVLLGAGIAMIDRKSTRLNSSHIQKSRMPSSA